MVTAAVALYYAFLHEFSVFRCQAHVLRSQGSNDTVSRPVYRPVSLPEGASPVEMRFRFAARRLGAARLSFRAGLEGRTAPSDALDGEVMVEAQQDPVDVATSFAIR